MIRGRDFLAVADDLAVGATEAHRRTAVGRVYYALFLEMRSAVERWKGEAPPRGQAHFDLAAMFIRAADPEARAHGLLLRRLREVRNRADYELLGTDARFVSSRRVGQELAAARAAIDWLDAIDQDDARRGAVVAGLGG
jgi:hypothetical protein